MVILDIHLVMKTKDAPILRNSMKMTEYSILAPDPHTINVDFILPITAYCGYSYRAAGRDDTKWKTLPIDWDGQRQRQVITTRVLPCFGLI
jgi:hypothetical protein